MLEEAKLFSSTISTGSWWNKPVPVKAQPAAASVSPVPCRRDDLLSPRCCCRPEPVPGPGQRDPALHLLPEETWVVFPCCCQQASPVPAALQGAQGTVLSCLGSGLGPAPCRTSHPLLWDHGWSRATALQTRREGGNPRHSPWYQS